MPRRPVFSVKPAPPPGDGDSSDRPDPPQRPRSKRRQQVAVACRFCQVRKCKVRRNVSYFYRKGAESSELIITDIACSATGKNQAVELASAKAQSACTTLMATAGGLINWGGKIRRWHRDAWASSTYLPAYGHATTSKLPSCYNVYARAKISLILSISPGTDTSRHMGQANQTPTHDHRHRSMWPRNKA